MEQTIISKLLHRKTNTSDLNENLSKYIVAHREQLSILAWSCFSYDLDVSAHLRDMFIRSEKWGLLRCDVTDRELREVLGDKTLKTYLFGENEDVDNSPGAWTEEDLDRLLELSHKLEIGELTNYDPFEYAPWYNLLAALCCKQKDLVHQAEKAIIDRIKNETPPVNVYFHLAVHYQDAHWLNYLNGDERVYDLFSKPVRAWEWETFPTFIQEYLLTTRPVSVAYMFGVQHVDEKLRKEILRNGSYADCENGRSSRNGDPVLRQHWECFLQQENIEQYWADLSWSWIYNQVDDISYRRHGGAAVWNSLVYDAIEKVTSELTEIQSDVFLGLIVDGSRKESFNELLDAVHAIN